MDIKMDAPTTERGEWKRWPEARAVARPVRRSRHYCTAWPKVGGADLEVGPTNLFAEDEFRDVFKPGDKRLAYAGGSPGLGAVSKSAAVPIYKISTCADDRLADRFYELNRDNCAGWRYVNGVLTRQEGFDRWFPSHLYPTLRPSPGSPVVAGLRSVEITLPESLSAEDFDREFDTLCRLGAVDAWSMTADGRQHCAALGVSPDELQRFTKYPGWTTSPVQEISGFSIYSGVDRLLAISEQIIARHLKLIWTPALR